MDFEEKTVSVKEIHNGRIIKLVDIEVKLPDGSTAYREIIRHKGASAVIPIKEDGKVIMVRQYRKPVEKALLEIPAGKLEKDEDPLECARRELKEETGYNAKHLKLISTIFPCPAYSEEKLFIYAATELEKGIQCTDKGEIIEVEEDPLHELVKKVINQEISDAKTVAAIMIVESIKEQFYIKE
jgi:ADP-ribose pyrophosphatase